MTKFLTKAALAATLATGLIAAPALAANSDAKPFTATAKIVKPLTLTKVTDLDFGTITMLPALSSQTVSVNPDNTTSCGGANLSCSFPAQAAASFTIAGTGNQSLTVDLGTPPTELSDGLGNVVSFTVDAPASTALVDGVGSFGVGGDIVVASSTADGTYTADLEVTVSYN